jgi:protein-S-isoprenylcysteine O-methyltransferase Ste14
VVSSHEQTIIGSMGVVVTQAEGIWFPLIEEKDLERRLGDADGSYRTHVPRSIPGLRPRRQADGDGRSG